MNIKTNKIKTITLSIVVFGIGFTLVSAWTGPTANPPSSNTTEPINIGANPQTKTGVFQSATSIRAPIYYDYPSTSYYINPASTSRLNTVKGNRMYAYNDMYIGSSAGDDSSDLFLADKMYDWDNTGYYVNPASTNRLNYVRGNRLRADNINIDGNEIRFYYSTDSIIRKTAGYLELHGSANGNSRIWLQDNRDRIYIGDGNTDLRLRGSISEVDSLCLSGSCRSSWPSTTPSPWVSAGSYIYYDSSNLRAKIGKNLTTIDGYQAHGYRAEHGSGAVSLGITDSGIAGVAFHYGPYSYAAFQTSEGDAYSRLYNSSNDWIFDNLGSHKYVIFDGGSGSISSSGSVSAIGTMTATAFHDRNNPGYYVDPAGASKINYLNVGTNATEGGEVRFIGSGGTFQFDNYNGNARIHTLRSGKYFEVIGGAGIRTNSSMRAPIFYDSNNTGYYVNPYGTSNVRDIRANTFWDRNNPSYYVDPDHTSRMNRITPNGITLGGVYRTSWPGGGGSLSCTTATGARYGNWCTATCPSGYTLTGGGADAADGAGCTLNASYPQGNSWRAAVFPVCGGGVSCWARCCKIQ